MKVIPEDQLIVFKNVFKEFDGQEVLSNINLYIRKNEFLTLLGPSGLSLIHISEPTRP